jgi:hypothetical protein
MVARSWSMRHVPRLIVRPEALAAEVAEAVALTGAEVAEADIARQEADHAEAEDMGATDTTGAVVAAGDTETTPAAGIGNYFLLGVV